MSDAPIWRYLSLAKYIDLLRTKSLYFPKASLFQDDTEGKWWGHALMFEQAEKWRKSPAKVRVLEELLERARHDDSALLLEMARLNAVTSDESIRGILVMAYRAYPHKRREVIEDVISSWKRNYAEHNQTVQKWKSESAIHRESTYISCWNRASSMSLAMWEMYGGGREAVAVRSTKSKLEGLIEGNASFLEENGLEGAVAEVEYLDGLKNPDEEVQERIYQIIFEKEQDYRIGLFTIKPGIFDFEREVRAIILPKRSLLDPVKDPHPNVSGFALSIAGSEPQGERSITHFIEKVYLHPTLDEGSITFQAVKEINKLFGVAEIPVVAEKIEAMGADITL